MPDSRQWHEKHERVINVMETFSKLEKRYNKVEEKFNEMDEMLGKQQCRQL